MVDKHGAADLSESFKHLSTAEREALAAKAETEPKPKPQANVFAVLVMPGGAALAIQDLAQLEQYDHAPASVEQIFNGCHTVATDLQASKTAQVVGMMLQQQANAVANQAETQRVLAELKQHSGRR